MTARYHERNGGLLRYDDLAKFQAEQVAPIRTTYRGYDVYQSPPNSGGIVMLLALNILEGFDLKKPGHNTPAYLHLLTEAFKLAFADRYVYITDPRFAPGAPIEALLSKRYAELRRGLIKTDRAIEGIAPPADPKAGRAILAGHAIRYHEPGEPAAAAAPRATCAPMESRPPRSPSPTAGATWSASPIASTADSAAAWWWRAPGSC
jgi:gamma-glutamyltranspeptidase/glutathione hydrolase